MSGFRLLCRLALSAVFGISGFSKMRDLRAFAYDLHSFELTPWSVSKPFAIYLVALEICTAFALLVPRLRVGAACSACGMTVMFATAIVSVWVRGIDISCGCFGNLAVISNVPLHLAGSVLMFAAGVRLIWKDHGKLPPSGIDD